MNTIMIMQTCTVRYVNKRTDSDGSGIDLRVGGWENLVESAEHLGQSKHK